MDKQQIIYRLLEEKYKSSGFFEKYTDDMFGFRDSDGVICLMKQYDIIAKNKNVISSWESKRFIFKREDGLWEVITKKGDEYQIISCAKVTNIMFFKWAYKDCKTQTWHYFQDMFEVKESQW